MKNQSVHNETKRYGYVQLDDTRIFFNRTVLFNNTFLGETYTLFQGPNVKSLLAFKAAMALLRTERNAYKFTIQSYDFHS